MQKRHTRLHLMTKAIQIENRALNAQNLTFIKTQSIVKSFFPLHILESNNFEWRALLIFHVAHFEIIFIITGINLLLISGAKENTKMLLEKMFDVVVEHQTSRITRVHKFLRSVACKLEESQKFLTFFHVATCA